MKKVLITFVIILVAFFFRFNNLNWDENFHLHPDERFLTMVGTAMKIPTSANQYFDQKISLMNPANIGYGFFVYGRFPLILTKYLASIYNLDNYNHFTILGRQLSAFFDILIIFFIIKTVGLIERKNQSIKYLAGFFYAIAVLPIQLSHFFAVDTFLNFFMFGSFCFSLKFYYEKKIKYLCFSAMFFGLALACKVTALFILPLSLFFIFRSIFKNKFSFKFLISLFPYFIIYLLISYLTLRLADPYYFQNKNIFDPTISKPFIENINSLKNMTVKNMDNWFPPMVQWLNKNTVQHSLVNNVVFGLGIPYAILVITGIGLIISNIKDQISKLHTKNQKARTNNETMKQWNNFDLLIILFWVLGFFIYQSLQVTPTLRYFLIIYPFLAIFAGIGINFILTKIKNKNLFVTCHLSFVILLLIWPLMFSSIYFHKNTRVESSEWIYKNLPTNSLIVGESWDDVLPMGVLNNYGKQFLSDQLPVFDPDTDEKWNKMSNMLMKADYYVLSSNRGWGSIPTVPQKYPLMSRFYNQLLADKNPDYKKIKELKPFYYRFFELPNNLVDESFTVYDHPEVLIFKNVKKL